MTKSNLPTLDLHGKQQDEIFDLVDNFLRKNATRPRVRIMPGKGKGLVRKKLEEYLQLGGYPWELERLANGTRNEGVFIVILD